MIVRYTSPEINHGGMKAMMRRYQETLEHDHSADRLLCLTWPMAHKPWVYGQYLQIPFIK